MSKYIIKWINISIVKRRFEGQGSKLTLTPDCHKNSQCWCRRVELLEESWKLSYIFCLGSDLAASRLWVWRVLVSPLWVFNLLRDILLISTSNTLFQHLDLRPTAKCVCTLTNMMAFYLKFNLRPAEQQACTCTVRLARLWGTDHNHFTHRRGRGRYLSCAHWWVAQIPLTSA